MPIPRHPRPRSLTNLIALYEILTFPLFLLYALLKTIIALLLWIVVLPWTLSHSSSNIRLSEEDNQVALGYVEEIELRAREEQGDLDVLLNSIKTSTHPVTVDFYPHFTTPAKEGKGNAHPKLSELFVRLERVGWGRGKVYDLFIALAATSAAGKGEDMTKELERIKTHACRGAFLPLLQAAFLPLERLFSLLFFEAAPAMLHATDLKPLGPSQHTPKVLDVDVKGDAKWILERGAVIRAKDRRTLEALEKLDVCLGLWKFVREEEEVREMGWWQYVVL